MSDDLNKKEELEEKAEEIKKEVKETTQEVKEDVKNAGQQSNDIIQKMTEYNKDNLLFKILGGITVFIILMSLYLVFILFRLQTATRDIEKLAGMMLEARRGPGPGGPRHRGGSQGHGRQLRPDSSGPGSPEEGRRTEGKGSSRRGTENLSAGPRRMAHARERDEHQGARGSDRRPPGQESAGGVAEGHGGGLRSGGTDPGGAGLLQSVSGAGPIPGDRGETTRSTS